LPFGFLSLAGQNQETIRKVSYPRLWGYRQHDAAYGVLVCTVYDLLIYTSSPLTRAVSEILSAFQ
jgi:hypothetical protein